MQIDEQKIINEFKENTSVLDDFKSYVKIEKAGDLKKRQKKNQLLVSVILVYLLSAVTLLLLYGNKASSIIFWPLKPSVENTKINTIEDKLKEIELEIKNLQLSATSNGDSSFRYLNSQVLSISDRQKKIEESINLDAEKALTAALIREKQKNLEVNFLELKNTQGRLESRLDNFVFTIILGPIVIAVLGFIFWLIQKWINKKSRKKELQVNNDFDW